VELAPNAVCSAGGGGAARFGLLSGIEAKGGLLIIMQSTNNKQL
jgi:hypothetical protein